MSQFAAGSVPAHRATLINVRHAIGLSQGEAAEALDTTPEQIDDLDYKPVPFDQITRLAEWHGKTAGYVEDGAYLLFTEPLSLKAA